MYDELIYNHLLRFSQQKKGSVIRVLMHDDSHKKRVFSCGRSVTVVFGLSVLLGGMTPAVANADEAADSIVAIEEIIDQNLPDAATFALDVTKKVDKGFGTVTFNLDMAGLPDTAKVVVRYSGSDGELITRTITSGEPLVVRSPDQGVHYVDTTFDYRVYLLEEADGDTDEVLTELEQFSGSLEIKAAPKEEVTTPEGFPTQGEPGESVIAPDWINNVEASHASETAGVGTIKLNVDADEPPEGVRLEMEVRTEPVYVGDYDDIVIDRLPVTLNEPMTITVPKDGVFDVTSSVMYGLVVTNDAGNLGGELSEGGGIFEVEGVNGDGLNDDSDEPTSEPTAEPTEDDVVIPEWVDEYDVTYEVMDGTWKVAARVDGEAPDAVSVLLRQRVTPLGEDGPGEVKIIETPIELNETTLVTMPEGDVSETDTRVVYELVVVNGDGAEEILEIQDSLFVVEGVEKSEEVGEEPATPDDAAVGSEEPTPTAESSNEATVEPTVQPTTNPSATSEDAESEPATPSPGEPSESAQSAKPDGKATDAPKSDEASPEAAESREEADRSDSSNSDDVTAATAKPEGEDASEEMSDDQSDASPSARPSASQSDTPSKLPTFSSEDSATSQPSATPTPHTATQGMAAPPSPGDGVQIDGEENANGEAVQASSRSNFDWLKVGGFALLIALAVLVATTLVARRKKKNRPVYIEDDES